MGCAGRRHAPGHRGEPSRGAPGCGAARGCAAGEPVGGLAASEDPEGRWPGAGRCCGNAPDLPAQPGRAGGIAGSARHILAAGAGRVRRGCGSPDRGGVMADTGAGTVRKQIVVDTPIERAFSAFTDRFGDFKPPEHNMLGAPIAETVFEPRVGGNIVDRAADGSECRWARILAFDPPERVVFSLDISPRWTIETDQAQTSEVEVRFYAESPTRTRVEAGAPGHLDRHGTGWQAITGRRGRLEGWPLYLDRYAALVKGGR